MVVPVFLIGLATGAALTLLLAPASGTATRRLMKKKWKEGENWVADKAEHASREVSDMADRLARQV